MKCKYLYSFLFLVLLFSISYTSSLECSLNEHYYLNYREVLVYGNYSFDGISFEVVGKNLDNSSRILNISITNSNPIQFESSLPDIPSDLRILQSKTLWISKIVDTKQFIDGEKINFTINISGFNEKNGLEENYTCSKEILIRTEENGFFYKAGKIIMPSNPNLGIFLAFILILGILYFLWNFEIGKKIQNFKLRKIRRKKLEEYENP